MNVLSLFDGMSTLQLAMKNVGIKVNKYYASEIKKYAIKLTQHHFPNTIQLGGINNWQNWDIDWGSIDFIGSGSPCQDLSIAGKRKGLNGGRSSLFWKFIDILNHIKKFNPNVKFLQENVGSAPGDDVGIMSRVLGVYPTKINSNLLTAQNRCRYYWTNIRVKKDGLFGEIISDIPQPKDRGVLLQDILESGYTGREKARAILESEGRLHKNMDLMLRRYNLGFGNVVFLDKNNKKIRPLTQIELERLQGFPDGYTSILSRRHAASLLGDGWTLPIIEHILRLL